MTSGGFRVQYPQIMQSAVVVASPHSGADYPKSLLKQSILDSHEIRSSEDAFVDALFSAAPGLGMAFLAAQRPRAYVDLNRSAQEMDPALVEDVAKRGQNPRVASGLGVIPRVVAQGKAIYRGKISLEEAEKRLNEVWFPYHRQLQLLLDQAHARCGCAVLLDCHSMPREALEHTGSRDRDRPQIVLGDRFGAAASGEIVDLVEGAFAAQGFVVARNSPFAGAYITQTYGRPSRGQHAIQVEIDRSLYMDEARIVRHAGFFDMRVRLTAALAEIAQIGCGEGHLAAE